MEKPEIVELLKNRYNNILKDNEKIRYSEGNFCVECLSSNNYHPNVYPYRQYLCHRCHSKYIT
jgi:hypothetical protein